MTRVVAPSRLHFGLFNVATGAEGPKFGGVGLMVERPGVVVVARPADSKHVVTGSNLDYNHWFFAQECDRRGFGDRCSTICKNGSRLPLSAFESAVC